MIIILTNKTDSHADHFIPIAQELGLSVFRLNTEDILNDYELTIRHGSFGMAGQIEDKLGRTIDLGRPAVGWYRKPSLDFKTPAHAPEYSGFVKSEVRALLDILYHSECIRWFNDPFFANQYKSKFQQLEFARKCGIKTPDTIITNTPSSALNFLEQANFEAITKAIYTANVTINGLNAAIPTTRIDKEKISDQICNVVFCPTQFQNEIKKRIEIRSTVVGEKVFSASIDSQSHDETKIDWRCKAELCEHRIHTLPDHIEEFCKMIVHQQGMEYGAIDFIIDEDGDYVFLENNPFGQYLWIEFETGLPITESIVSLFKDWMC